MDENQQAGSEPETDSLGDPCIYPRCEAHFLASLVREPDHSVPGSTGWHWPLGSANEPDDVPAHDHRTWRAAYEPFEAPPKLPRPDEDLHGEWSPAAEKLREMFLTHIEMRQALDDHELEVLAQMNLVPKHERTALAGGIFSALVERYGDEFGRQMRAAYSMPVHTFVFGTGGRY